MENIIDDVKAEFNRAKGRIAHDLASTPDDKINWAPSETARTPVQLVAHGAMGTMGITGMLAGKPFPYNNMQEMDTASRAAEKEFTSREQALGFLEKTSNEFLEWLDTLSAEQIASTVSLPFGDIPMAMAITFPADHLRCHAAQIEYLQTIYGDYSMHG
jgi:hypothetical protein